MGSFNTETGSMQHEVMNKISGKPNGSCGGKLLVFTRLILKHVHFNSSKLCFCSCSVIKVIMILPKTQNLRGEVERLLCLLWPLTTSLRSHLLPLHHRSSITGISHSIHACWNLQGTQGPSSLPPILEDMYFWPIMFPSKLTKLAFVSRLQPKHSKESF